MTRKLRRRLNKFQTTSLAIKLDQWLFGVALFFALALLAGILIWSIWTTKGVALIPLFIYLLLRR